MCYITFFMAYQMGLPLTPNNLTIIIIKKKTSLLQAIMKIRSLINNPLLGCSSKSCENFSILFFLGYFKCPICQCVTHRPPNMISILLKKKYINYNKISKNFQIGEKRKQGGLSAFISYLDQPCCKCFQANVTFTKLNVFINYFLFSIIFVNFHNLPIRQS